MIVLYALGILAAIAAVCGLWLWWAWCELERCRQQMRERAEWEDRFGR